MIKIILVPVDGTERSAAVLDTSYLLSNTDIITVMAH